jgi:hypothetical protein
VISKNWVWALGFILFLAGRAEAGNGALAQLQAVPAGERVANYLQSLMSLTSQILAARNQGGIDLFNERDAYRVSITYNPDLMVVEASIVGTHDDPKATRDSIELTKGLILGFNKRLQKNFGVTLTEEDLSVDYLNAKTGKILLRYHGGKYLSSSPTPGATPSSLPGQDKP